MSSDQTRAQPEGPPPASDQTAAFSTDTPPATKSPATQSDTKAESNDNATGAWAQQGTRAESPDNSNATANFTSGPVGRRASAVLQTSLGGYEIMGELGRGGMGVVYKAHQRGLNRIVALKMVLAGGHASDEQLKRFLVEARAVAHLQHPNIVQVFDIGENEGLPFFSLEYVDGEPLSRKLAKQPQPPKEAAAIMVIIAKAMQYAHDNKILHRDLKPANILLTSAGVPKIADFGLAKQIEDNDDGGATRTGTVIGTPSYMAPEQARGDTHVIGPPTDQYALGAMLYEMLTGRPPFAAARQVDTILQVIKNEPIPPRQLEEKIPADLETICLKALQKDIAKRYESCGEFAADMERFLRGEPILARPVSHVERGIRWCKRNPLVASLSAVAVTSLIVVTCVSTWSAMTLSTKNAQLAEETARANLNAENEKKQAAIAKTNEAEAKKQEGIAKENESKAKEQEELAKTNEGKAKDQARELEKYIQQYLLIIPQIDDIESPQIRPYREALLNLALVSSEKVVEQLGASKDEKTVPTRMNINNQLIGAYRRKGEGAKALEKNEEVLKFAEERVKVANESDLSRHNYIAFINNKAEMKRDYDRDLKASLELSLLAEKIADEVLKSPRDNGAGIGKAPLYMSKYQVASARQNVATTLYRMGDPLAAEKRFQSARVLYEDILGSLDADPEFQTKAELERQRLKREFASIYARINLAIGSALYRVGKPDEGEPYLQKAVEPVEKDWNSNRNSAKRRLAYIDISGMKAEFNAQFGMLDQALPIFEANAKLAEDALAFDPKGQDARRSVSIAYYRLGQWREESGMGNAKEMFDKCSEIRQENLASDSANERRKIELVLALGRTGDFAKTDELAAELAKKENADSEMLLDLARGVAQASKHTPGDRKAEFLAKAIDMVRRAKDQGFRDLVYLEKEIDFKPLWELPEFKAITAEIRSSQTAIEYSAPAKVE